MTYEEIIQFHGHDCPGLAMGYRMATAAMKNLESFRADDEELVAIVENDACGVDALQCVTGCTFGKGNLRFRDYGKHVYTIYARNTRTGVRVYFHGRASRRDCVTTETRLPNGFCRPPAKASFPLKRYPLPRPNRRGFSSQPPVRSVVRA